MKKHYFWAFMLLAPAAIVSCSDIDLNDVNTDVALKVRDLTLPVQLDKVTLGAMLDTDNDSKIKVVNGEYAIVVDGDFKSDVIRVEPIVIPAEDVDAIVGKIGKKRPSSNSAARVKRQAGSSGEVVAIYALPTAKEILAAHTDKVHEAIAQLTSLEVATTFNFHVDLAEHSKIFDLLDQVHLENFSVKIPRGIVGNLALVTSDGKRYDAAYSPETGIISFAGMDIVTADGQLEVVGEVKGIDHNLLDPAFNNIAASRSRVEESSATKELSIEEYIGVDSGDIVVYTSDFKDQSASKDEMYNSLDDDLSFVSQPEMEDIVITSVSGSFNYDVADMKLENVNLSDIPDILRETGTDLRLSNPQIYFYLHNSVIDGEGKAIGASTQMTVTAADDNGNSRDYTLENAIVADEEENYIYISPKSVADDQKLEGFENAKHVEFADLGNVLSAVSDESGVPTRLDISTFNTHVGSEKVTNLELGKDYGLDGRYSLLAPLALSPESRIKYTNTIDGWSDDTEGIVVTQLALSATATTDVPFEVVLRVWPVNARGERLTDEAGTLVLPANAKEAPIAIALEGNIDGLDGVKIDVTATSKEARSLSPDMNIFLSGLKVKVSGKYEAEL